MHNKVNTNIELTPVEKEVIDLLNQVVSNKAPNTTLRIVGGWVRDHLLGVPSSDIDVMVDNMSGEKFAKLVTEYLGAKDAHTIRENPEKSKFIETAKAFLPLSSGNTQEVDFAMARKEVYHGDSRIPDIKMATPEEDAMRRDLTINSLFYNLKTRQIEDFTGKGIQDLITNTMRTPADPIKTFKDDPLRIFRVLRFTAKYNGTIDPLTYEAMQNPSLKEDIRKKVSKERIGAEIKKMLSNKNPAKAITLLKETGLLSDILEESLKGSKYEGKMAPLDMNQNNPNHKLSLWGHTMQVISNVLEKYPEADEEKRVVLILSALCHDLGKLYNEIQKQKEGIDKYPGHEKGYTTYVGHEEESAEIANLILKFLKLEPYMQQVSGLSRYHMQPHSLVRDDASGQKALRKFIRRMGELSLNWLDVFNLSVADAYSKSKEVDPSVVQNYQELEKALNDALLSLSVKTDEKIKPILDGNEVMNILGIKPGPQMKDITEFIKELRDDNPNISKEEAAQKLKERFAPKTVPVPTTNTIKEAAKDKKKTSTCPQHLIRQKSEDINKLFAEGRLYEVNSTIKELIKEYGKNEQVARLVALCTFKILCKDSELKDINILQYIFDYAKDNFFDYIIGAYVIGILLITDTDTKDEVIIEVATRTSKLSPGNMKYVLELIPNKKIRNKKLFAEILRII